MKTVLAVDADASSRAAMAETLRLYCPEMNVLVAPDAPMGVQLLRRRKVDLVLTGLRPHKLDEFQLLSYLMNRHPKTPALVMSGRDWREPALSLSPSHVPTPHTSGDAEVMASRLRRCLERRRLGHPLGITLLGLLQLLHQEGVTCMLHVASGRRRGVLFVQGGEIVHARCHALEGNAAAFQVLNWSNPSILLLNHPRDLRHSVTLRTGLLLKLLSTEGGLGPMAENSQSQKRAGPQTHHAPPGPDAFKAARQARHWTEHANHRLNWWDDKPASKWQWWPASLESEEG